MSEQFSWLTAALILALVHVFLTAGFKRRQDGMAWAGGSRDEPRVYTGAAARLDRAQKNLAETLWIFVAALLVAHLAGRDGALNLWGARLFVPARIVYVPLYALGINPARSLVYCVATVGLVLTLLPLL